MELNATQVIPACAATSTVNGSTLKFAILNLERRRSLTPIQAGQASFVDSPVLGYERTID
jgi:hypothetical protein